MSNAIATVMPKVTVDQIEVIKKTIATDASPEELKLYIYDCQRRGVHPLDRLLHFTKRGGKYTPITSIDLLRSRADATGEYVGSDDAIISRDLDVKHPSMASVTVWRLVSGIKCSFSATARWEEYCPAEGNDFMWKKMPYLMLSKCAEALALRKAFPQQLSGLYTSEEMDQAGLKAINEPTGNQTPPKQEFQHELSDDMASDKQVKMLVAIKIQNGVPQSVIDEFLQEKNKFTLSTLTSKEVGALKKILESYKAGK